MLTEPQLMAAELVAHDRLSIPGIAQRVGVGRSTIRDWKTQPEFQAEVERLLNSWAKDIYKHGIADERRCWFRINDRWRRGQAFIEKRARLFKRLREVEPLLLEVAGGETGFVSWKYRTIHLGEKEYQKVVDFEFDTGLWDAMNKIEQQAAILKGRWKQQHEIAVTVSEDAKALAEILTPEELKKVQQRLLARATQQTTNASSPECQSSDGQRGDPVPDV